MIANDRETPFEIAVKMIAAPNGVPIYFAGVGVMKLSKAWSRRKAKRVEPEILAPVQPTWIPTRDIERAVYAALILAGEPVNDRRLCGADGLLPRRVLTAGRAARRRDPQGPQGSRGFDQPALEPGPAGAIRWGFSLLGRYAPTQLTVLN